MPSPSLRSLPSFPTAGPKSQKARLRIIASTNSDLTALCTVKSGQPTRFLGGAGYGGLGRRGEEKNEPQGQTSVRLRRTYSVRLAFLIPSEAEVGRPAGCSLLHSVHCHRSDRKAEIAKGSPAHPSHPRTPIGRLRRDASLASALGPPYASMLVTSSIGCGSRDAEGILG